MMKKKWRINWKTVARNLFIILNIVVVAVLIYTIKTKGLGFFSTIRIFWIGGFNYGKGTKIINFRYY